MKWSCWFLPLCVLLAVGCDRWEEAEPGTAPRSGDLSQSEQKVQPQRPEYDLEMLDSKFSEASAAFEADASTKNEFIQAAVAYADALTLGPGEPKKKYPAALAIYERVLEVDPQNAAAAKGRQTILDVYASMGMEPPKTE